jgi:hypothetical protein
MSIDFITPQRCGCFLVTYRMVSNRISSEPSVRAAVDISWSPSTSVIKTRFLLAAEARSLAQSTGPHCKHYFRPNCVPTSLLKCSVCNGDRHAHSSSRTNAEIQKSWEKIFSCLRWYWAVSTSVTPFEATLTELPLLVAVAPANSNGVTDVDT